MNATSQNMRERCFCHNYRERDIYMITLETDGRRSLHGRLDGERIALSPLGETVAACWRQIPRFHPEVRLLESVVMSDHFHGLLFVTRRMATHLGEVVRGFKIGCTKEMRAIYGSPPNGTPPNGGQSGGGPYMARSPRKALVTRIECLELNRIAAKLCGEGAAKLDYAGIVPQL